MRRTPAARLLACLLLASVQLGGSLLPAAALVLASATEAQAQRRASSGGYSRPRATSRTPSVGGGGGFRTPSVASSGGSAGYGLPGGGRRPSLGSSFGSASDRSYSRTQSSDALRRMRQRQAEQAAPVPGRADPGQAGRAPGATQGGGSGFPGGFGGLVAPRGGAGYAQAPRGDWRNTGGGGWFRDRGWSQPGYASGGRGSFGIWNAALLWFMLDSLNRPGHADFFRANADDPGAREWRAEAERLARNDTELRAKLDELDRRTAAADDAAPAPGYLPPGVPEEVAIAQDSARRPSVAPAGEPDGEGGGASPLLGVVLVGGGALAFLAWRRSRAAREANGDGGRAVGGTGGAIGTAGAMLRNKLEGRGYAPEHFRVGMTVTVDPTPFLLLGGETSVPQPRAAESVSVASVGRIAQGGLVRLYLPEGRDMFQLHLGADGAPDECRYLGLLDEITPADAAEWAVWLDPAQGLIGWPEFQTKDGRLYARAWSPGEAKVPPRALDEQVEGEGGGRVVRSQAMLYAAPTNAAEPAPPTEYVLVSAIEDGDRAWIEVRAGIDVSPASLSLA